MKRVLALLICSISLLCTTYGQWHEVNNGLFGGHVGGLYLDPETNVLIAGTGNCGIFISTDDGQYWKTSNTGLPDQVYNIESFIRSGTDLFAAGNNNEGVFLSTDNGKTWVNKKNGLPVYAAVKCLTLSSTKLFVGTSSGVYLSFDNAESWTAVNNGLEGTSQYVNSLAVKDGKIFAGTMGGLFVSADDGGSWVKVNLGLEHDFIKTITVDGEYIYAGAPLGKFCISSDNGSSWTIVDTGLPFAVDFQYLAVNNGIIYGGTTGGGVCISTDNGIIWKQFNNVLSKKTINKLVINGDKIFAATELGVFLSNDNCSSWTMVNNGLTNIPVTCTVRSGTRLIVGTRGNGLYSSSDNGNIWAPVNINITSEAPWVFGLTANENYVYASTIDGVYVSADNGLTWEKGNLSYPNYINIAVQETAIIGDKIFAATEKGMYVSTDNGKNWITNEALKDQGLFSLTSKDNTLYAGTCAGIFMSTDLGITWTDINNGLSLTDNCIWSIVTKDNNLFFTSNDGVFMSSNNGSSWTAVNNGFPSLTIPTMTINGNSLFTSVYSDGIFMSTNDGTSWTQVNTGLQGPAMIVNSIRIIGDEIYAGTNKGIWKRLLADFQSLSVSSNSINIGALQGSTASFNITSNINWSLAVSDTWLSADKVSGYGNASVLLTARVNSTFEPRITSVTVSSPGLQDKTIVVTQETNGETTYAETTENDILKVYPNPAKEYLIINTGANSEYQGYSLKILNMLGKVVFETKVIKNEYEIQVASWSAKGIYVVQIYNDSKKIIATKKIILQ